MFKIRLAGRLFCIDNKYPYMEGLCRDYIADGPGGMFFSVTDGEIRHEAGGDGDRSEGYLESLALCRRICETLVWEDTVLFHCSALELDGTAYLFTGRSGIGKSTHTRLWRECFGGRVAMINDDKPLLRIGEAGTTAYGTPWCGKHNIQNNTSACVGGIVILRQGEANSVRRLTEREAFPALLGQAYRPADAAGTFRVMELVQRLCGIPVYELYCNISTDAVETAYRALTGGAGDEA